MRLCEKLGDTSKSVSNLSDIGMPSDNAVDYDGHSSNFIQVLDESLSLVREDLNDWLQRYLFSDLAPAIPAHCLLLRLGSGLWLSRLAYKLQQSVFSQATAKPPPQPAYQFLRGAVSNPALRSVSRASLPPFPRTLMLCATRVGLGEPDVCAYPPAGDLPSSQSSSPMHSSRDSSPVQTRRVSDRWLARDNVSSFIQWCRELGIPQTVIFETTGLVHRTEEKNVLLTLMELARLASRYGLVDLPELVRIEREIDALEEARATTEMASTSTEDTGAGSQCVAQTNTTTPLEPADGAVGPEIPSAGSDPSADPGSGVPPQGRTSSSSPTQVLSPKASLGSATCDLEQAGTSDRRQKSTGTDAGCGDAESTPLAGSDGEATGRTRVSLETFVQIQPFTGVEPIQQQNSQATSPSDYPLRNVTKRRANRGLDTCEPQPKRVACQDPQAATRPAFATPIRQGVESGLNARTPCTVLRRLNLNRSPSPTDVEVFEEPVFDTEKKAELLSGSLNRCVSATRTRALNENDQLVAEQLEEKLAQCTCCSRMYIQRLEEGRYRLGRRIYYLRRFRNHVMMRVGGGWLTLDEFLNRYDPCRKGNTCMKERNGAAPKTSLPVGLNGGGDGLSATGPPQSTVSTKTFQPPTSVRGRTASSGNLSATLPGHGIFPTESKPTTSPGMSSSLASTAKSGGGRVRPPSDSRQSPAKRPSRTGR